MPYQMHAPLDPECPAVQQFHRANDNDPISQQCGCMDDIYANWERRHRANCERCQEYGAANIEVTD